MKYILLIGVFGNMYSSVLLAKTNPVSSVAHMIVGLFLSVLLCLEFKIGGKK